MGRIRGKTKENFYYWLAWKLPRELVYICCMRMCAHATTGRYKHQIVPDLTWDQMCERWWSSNKEEVLHDKHRID